MGSLKKMELFSCFEFHMKPFPLVLAHVSSATLHVFVKANEGAAVGEPTNTQGSKDGQMCEHCHAPRGSAGPRTMHFFSCFAVKPPPRRLLENR